MWIKYLALSLVAALFVLLVASANARTVFKTEELTGSDGEKVCVYQDGFDNVYRKADFGGYCPQTTEVP